MEESNANRRKPDTLPKVRFSYSTESIQIIGLLIDGGNALKKLL